MYLEYISGDKKYKREIPKNRILKLIFDRIKIQSMKSIKLILIGIISLAMFSCENYSIVDEYKKTTEKTNQDSNESNKPDNTEETTNEIVDMGPIYGIDISRYQGDEISLMDKSKDSLSFVICRASEGVTYSDPNFQTNWKITKEKGYIRGAYHFYSSVDNPEQQAEHFLSLLSDLEVTDLPPIIDFEESSIAKGSNKEQVIEDLWKFIFLVEEKSGRKPIIYTDVNIGNSYLTASRFANYTLWIANYTSAESPTIPGAWKGMEWVLWQKSDNYTFDNIQNDFDVFNGNIADLKKFIAESVVK